MGSIEVGGFDDCEDGHSTSTSEFNYINEGEEEGEIGRQEHLDGDFDEQENEEKNAEMANIGQIEKGQPLFWGEKLEEIFREKFEGMKNSIFQNIEKPEMIRLNEMEEKIDELAGENEHLREMLHQNTKLLEAFGRGQKALREENEELRGKLERVEHLMEHIFDKNKEEDHPMVANNCENGNWQMLMTIGGGIIGLLIGFILFLLLKN